jgi:hypothetical protein
MSAGEASSAPQSAGTWFVLRFVTTQPVAASAGRSQVDVIVPLANDPFVLMAHTITPPEHISSDAARRQACTRFIGARFEGKSG